ncbi:argonaute/piwi family protein [Micromonospora sp. WMMD1274]|uniref:argonaute/piwi family protein n=1 Tax=Micromonospora sp. WMMD1274 TaxID=3404116 RepID=UPI003B930025
MKLTILEEPPLEFGGGARHIDPRHGITDYGPADAAGPQAMRTIRAGIVGTPAAIQGLRRWLDRCRLPIDAKDSRLGHLFVPFPGFDAGAGFRSTLVWDSRLERPIRDRDLKRLADLKPQEATREAVDLYAAELDVLDEEPACDVILIARPDKLAERPAPQIDPEAPWRKAPPLEPVDDFRALLKAVAMRYSRPIQIVRRSTWDPSFKPPGTDKRRLQDEATRAWNLHTALYYKAGGVPWRLPRNPTDLTSCYVGVTFYRSSDHTTLETSVAQVFNQRGDGVIVRGAAATVSRHDRQPHLDRADAQKLLTDALSRYRAEHRTLPARVVLHKTSSYTPDEIGGFRTAADIAGIDSIELIWLPASDPVRLFRDAAHPPLRGTLLSVDERRHVLYTRGSVPFYGTYPGMYIPSPLPFRLVDTESSPEQIAEELLALTKMNWNQTQLDARQPITTRTADRVGQILRHFRLDERPQGRYAFYM